MYETVSGETWDVISKKVYGNELFMHHLMAANCEHIDVFVFKAGVKLIVPDVDTTEVSYNTLPPWKRT